MSEEQAEADTSKSHLDNLSEDQLLRCFIFERYAEPEYEGYLIVQNMDKIFHWIKAGVVPVNPKAKPTLKEV